MALPSCDCADGVRRALDALAEHNPALAPPTGPTGIHASQAGEDDRPPVSLPGRDTEAERHGTVADVVSEEDLFNPNPFRHQRTKTTDVEEE